MIKLYQWPAQEKLANSGIFCMKLESYLKLMKIDHTVTSTTSVGKSPKKTMPYIEKDGEFISDSRLIIEMLDAKMPVPIDQHLTSEQRALSTAYIAMLENHLVQVLAYYRWQSDSGWSQFSRLMFSGAPAVIRVLIGGVMRKGMIKNLYKNGIGRHTEPEVRSFGQKDIDSLANLLGNKPYVFGDKISLLDLVMFSVLSNILHGQVDMPLVAITKSHSNLVAHAERVLNLVYQKSYA